MTDYKRELRKRQQRIIDRLTPKTEEQYFRRDRDIAKLSIKINRAEIELPLDLNAVVNSSISLN